MKPSTRAARSVASVAALACTALVTVPASTADAAPAATSAQDRAYLKEAARANLAEVAAGRLAARKSQVPAVREFGREMVRDHTRQYRALTKLADTLGLDLPERPSQQQRHLAQLWATSSASGFTCAYVPYQWGDHQLVIAMTEEQVEEGTNPDVVAAAEKSLPVLTMHLRHVSKLLMGLDRC